MTERLRAAFFEEIYADDPDPWRFETSAYERAKYDATIAALEGRRFANGLEIGCSIGVLTQRLATRVDDLLAIDVAATALDRARARDLPNVAFELREVPEQFPDGAYDLIVISEVMYYLDCACQIQIDACSAGMHNVQIMSEAAARTSTQQFNRPDRPAHHKDWPALLRMLERRGVRYAE